jgi:alpha-glucosidase
VLTHYRDTLAFRKKHRALIDGAMTFLDTNQDLLVFTRKKEGETLLFVFNLTREPASFGLPAGIVLGERMEMPGAGGTVDGGKVVLGALEGFCARVV